MGEVERVHFSGTEHRIPEPASRGYARIVARGCSWSDSYYGGSFSCDHGYTWACDDCPCNRAPNPLPGDHHGT